MAGLQGAGEQSPLGFGQIATGMQRIAGPGGVPIDIGVPGGVPSNLARDQLKKASDSAVTVFRVQEMLDDGAFDLFGPDAATFNFLRTSLQGELTEMLNLGVINSPSELENILKLAPAPNLIGKVGADGAFTTRSSFNASYQELSQVMESKYREFATRYQFWPGMNDLLPQQVSE